MTYRELYLAARSALSQRDDPQAAGVIARDLLCTFSEKTPEQMLQDIDQPVDRETAARVNDGINRLLEEEPLAYVLGQWEFYV